MKSTNRCFFNKRFIVYCRKNEISNEGNVLLSLVMVLQRLMWFLFVAIFVVIEHAIDVYEVIGNEVDRGHIFVLGSFAMPIHFGEHGQLRKVAYR